MATQAVNYLATNRTHMPINRVVILMKVALKDNNIQVKCSLTKQSAAIQTTLFPLDQQGFDPQAQQGNSFVQNVQYQTIPQYGN